MPDQNGTIIAIDGPAAAGKSTLGRILAEKLAYLFFDTGVMYRTVTLAALESGVDIHDRAAMGALAQAIHIDVIPAENATGPGYRVLLDGDDVTDRIHTAEVERSVSIPSANPAVREAMTTAQRRIADRGSVVMVGRDIGTVVIPKAPVKLYITASVEERAQRRYDERLEMGVVESYEDILASMRARDALDSGRAIAPLRPAEDAIVIDTTGIPMESVVSQAAALIAEKTGILIMRGENGK